MDTWDVLKMLFPIFLILGLLLTVLYYLKKTKLKIGSKRADPLDMKVIYTLSILPKRYISLVKLADKILVLGISDNSVNLLKEIQWEEKFDSFIKSDSTFNKTFSDILKQYIPGK